MLVSASISDFSDMFSVNLLNLTFHGIAGLAEPCFPTHRQVFQTQEIFLKGYSVSCLFPTLV